MIVPPSALLVFLRRPTPGEVKTRLAAGLGEEAAAELYRWLAERVLGATAPGPYARLVFHAPAEAGPEIAAWLPHETLLPQAAGDLGARMAAAFEAAFRRGHGRAAIVGTDAPDLDRVAVERALLALDDHDVAIAPAEDGGYALLALREPHPELFDGVEWSTPRVLRQTLDRAAALRVALLPPLPDLDTLDDLRRAWPRLRDAVPSRLRDRIEASLSRGLLAGP